MLMSLLLSCNAPIRDDHRIYNTYEQGIDALSYKLVKNLPQDVSRAMPSGKIAVLPWEVSGNIWSKGEYVSSLLQVALFQTSPFILLERSKITQLLKEQQLILSGVVEDGKISRIGNLLGADYLCAGNIMSADGMKGVDKVVGKILDVQTGTIVSIADVYIKSSGADHPVLQTQSTTLKIQNNGNAQDLTVYISKTGSKYHKTGCKYLKSSAIPLALSHARKKGYSSCSVCFPK